MGLRPLASKSASESPERLKALGERPRKMERPTSRIDLRRRDGGGRITLESRSGLVRKLKKYKYYYLAF